MVDSRKKIDGRGRWYVVDGRWQELLLAGLRWFLKEVKSGRFE